MLFTGRPFFAIAGDRNGIVDPEIRQVLASFLRSLLAQCEIIFRAAALITMTFDKEFGLGMVFQESGALREIFLAFIRQPPAIKGKVDVSELLAGVLSCLSRLSTFHPRLIGF